MSKINYSFLANFTPAYILDGVAYYDEKEGAEFGYIVAPDAELDTFKQNGTIEIKGSIKDFYEYHDDEMSDYLHELNIELSNYYAVEVFAYFEEIAMDEEAFSHLVDDWGHKERPRQMIAILDKNELESIAMVGQCLERPPHLFTMDEMADALEDMDLMNGLA